MKKQTPPSPQEPRTAFEVLAAAILAVPKAEVAELEAKRTKRPKGERRTKKGAA